MNDESAETATELAELDRQIAIRRTSLDTGVPASMLGQAGNEDEARALAEQAIAWQRETAPTPPATAAVGYRVGQISRSTLPYLSPEQQMAAYRQGRLEEIGAPPPPRNGAHHAAP